MTAPRKPAPSGNVPLGVAPPLVTVPSSASSRARGLAALALAGRRAFGGAASGLALALLALEAAIFSGLAFVSSVRGTALPELVLVAGVAVAWSSGLLFSVAGSRGALPRDEAEGVLALVLGRGVAERVWVLFRLASLVGLVAAALLPAVLLVGLSASAAAARSGAPGLARAVLAAAVYVVAFALVIAPLAWACLAYRARPRGISVLLLLIVVPEMLARAGPSDPSVRSLSLLSALRVLRDAAYHGAPASAVARSAVGLLLVALAAVAVAYRRPALATEPRS